VDPPSLSFVFIDDTHHPKTKLYSLTGVFVPVSQYRAVRDDFYAILKPFIQPEPNVVNLQPPELHGSALLHDRPDSEKLRVLQQIVDIVNRHSLRCLRVDLVDGLDLRRMAGMAKGVNPEDVIYGVCWGEFVWQLQDALESSMLVPIMDTFRMERQQWPARDGWRRPNGLARGGARPPIEPCSRSTARPSSSPRPPLLSRTRTPRSSPSRPSSPSASAIAIRRPHLHPSWKG
jgi:hypothetical protein